MVAGLCRALLRDQAEAEDAAQQVFLSAHRSLLNGAEPREAPAWLATIARNECWARISGRMREPLPSDAADDVAGTADPVAEAIRRADLAALWRAIRSLPKQQREALLLREFGGLRYDELAAALAVTEPAVESLLFRARARLRAQLETAAAALAPLARLLVSGGAPAVATKAVAIGLGAAAVTGTAVIAPTMVEHHPRRAPHTRPQTIVAAVRESAPVAAAQLPRVVRHVSRPPAPAETRDHPAGEAGAEESGESTVEKADDPTAEPDRRDAGGGDAGVTEQEHTSTESGSGGGGEDGDHTTTMTGTTATTTTTPEPTTTTEPTTTDQSATLPAATIPQVDGVDG